MGSLKRFIGPAIIAAALAAGGAAGVALTSGSTGVQLDASQGTTGTAGSTASTAQGAANSLVPVQAQTADPNSGADDQRPKGPHQVGDCTEQVLSGDNASKAEAAAKKAVAGGTIERLETDCDGASYEAHMTKSDGSHVTVLMDKDFNVTSVEEGHGPGGHHGGPRDGNDDRNNSGTSTNSSA